MALYKELSVWADVEEWVETEGCAANVDDARRETRSPAKASYGCPIDPISQKSRKS